MSSVINDIQSAPQTFSSWDSCIQKAYCKWPAIVGIIIASLIVLSIVWCIASCLCCGATLCGSCIKCLTCFGCCGMCKTGRSGGGGRKSRHRDDYSQMPPTPYNGYQPSPAQMSYNRAAPASQFAHFDVSNKNSHVHEDALPAMPTWANATSRRVEDTSEPPNRYAEDVEMGRMAPSPHATRGAYSQLPATGPNSPLSPGPNQGYFAGQSHPYQSDLSTQRMHQNGSGQDSGFQPVPLSPAPTYTTHPQPHQAPAMAITTDQFATHAPTPQEYSRSQNDYHHDDHYNQYQQSQSQYMPPQQYGVARTSRVQSPPQLTRYETSDYNNPRSRSISPPSHDYPEYSNNYEQSQTQQTSNQNMRPPSLLQVGRKPVQGSHREI